MSKKSSDIDNKIQMLRAATIVAGVTTVGSALLNSAHAQTDTQDPLTNNTERAAYIPQRTDYINSNAEKLFDMYRLAYNDDSRFNMVAEKEKTKCQTFFDKHPDLKRKCNEVDARLKTSRGLQGFNNAELIYRREGDNNLRAEILEKLAKDPQTVAEMNKINTNAADISATEQQTAHIWSMYVDVETGNAPQAYKKFFDKYPQLYENCASAADKAGITKEMLPFTTIADPNAELQLSGAESLTETLSNTMNEYEAKTEKTIKLPSSTYQVTASDFSR